ncbi:MAG TPA: tetratricopeptide repeat protein [Chitinophagales bacterium]|nr:tetratricopeptide repeat protein [Chitinophagales bacterium]
MRTKIFFVAIMLAATMVARSQSPQDIQLADQYFSNGEFDKAVILYEKLWNKNQSNTQFYQNYLTCLTELKQYDDAVKTVRKQIKKSPDDLSLYVDLGGVYQKQGNEKAANAQYEDAINKLTPNIPQITKLASRFLTGGLTDYSIQTYLKGRKIFNAEGSDLFLADLAGLYSKKGDVHEAVKSYLDILETDPNQKEYVQGQLQPLLEKSEYAKVLQAELYSRIQKKPDVEQLADMLVWYFVQKKDFSSAFLQVKALDKRNKEDGNRIFQFAQSAFDEGYYDAALNAYHYIITEKGKSSYLYLPARTSELTTEKTKITIQHKYTQEELNQLESSYQAYLDEFGKGPKTLVTMRDYANLEAKFLHNTDKAISILQEAIAIGTNDKKLNGYLKLDLGDDQLIQGQQWEAMLLYGQVDKSFHDEPLGEEARFKNAKLSFYMGDFDWSQTQLDILKSATTELVSNDAIALSVFITDNMGLDTTPDAMKMYARADLLIFQNRFDDAVNTLDSLSTKFPEHSLNDDVLFEKGRIYLSEQKFTEAAAMFDRIDSTYSFDLLGDDALFQLAELEQNYLNDKDKAMELYKLILTKYKGSIFTVEARKRFRELRGDEVN